jgi:hypothetical protein
MHLPPEYPHSPPRVKWETKIFHPSITETGIICLGILRNDWTPCLAISQVLLALIMLLVEPNPDDAIVIEVGRMMIEDPEGYKRVCREWVEEYAREGPEGGWSEEAWVRTEGVDVEGEEGEDKEERDKGMEGADVEGEEGKDMVDNEEREREGADVEGEEGKDKEERDKGMEGADVEGEERKDKVDEEERKGEGKGRADVEGEEEG